MGGDDFQKGSEGPTRVKSNAIINRIQRYVNRYKSDRERMITDHCDRVMKRVSRVLYNAVDERKEYAILIFETPKRPEEETWRVTKRILETNLRAEGLEFHIIRKYDEYAYLDFRDFPSNWYIDQFCNQTGYSCGGYQDYPQLSAPRNRNRLGEAWFQFPDRLVNAVSRGYSDKRHSSAFREAAIFLHWKIEYPDGLGPDEKE